jgi:lysophospholipase L1-like esterase
MLLGILVIIVALVLFEGAGLFLLYQNVDKYSKYWETRAHQSGELTYLALGDSAAQGLGASAPEKGYVGIIAARLASATGKSIRVVNLSTSGARVQDVLHAQLPKVEKYKPDFVTMEIGANDTAQFDAQQFKDEFQQLVMLLPPGSYVSNMPYFGSRPGRRPAAYETSRIIRETAATSPSIRFVDLQAVTKERDSWRNYAADIFHPNNRSYKNWADAFWQEIEEDIHGKL